MDKPETFLPLISPEFMALCEAQVVLLSESLGAVSSAVYLTQTQNNKINPTLIPVLVYPSSHSHSFLEENLSNLPLLNNQYSLPDSSSSNREVESNSPLDYFPYPKLRHREFAAEFNPYSQGKYELVIPLVYEHLVLGLLATQRQDREWNQQEFSQIEKIADTMAIARVLDQKQSFSQDKLKQQLSLNHLQQENLDNLIHQIRNPLTALRTFIKLLLKKLLPDDSNFSIAQNMLQQTERIEELITDFQSNTTDYNSSLIIYPKSSPNFLLPSDSFSLERLSVEEILQPLLIAEKAIAQNKNIELTEKIFNNLPLVLGNKKALREVLNNLLDNALKYTPEGGKIHVEVGKQKTIAEGKMLAIEISDTGYGIPVEDQEHIFKRHYRGVQKESEISGSGLGLAIVKDLCDKMKAKIEIFSPSLEYKNQDYPGTTFIVWLIIA
jgi:signal transduction histidine kinase